MSLLRLKNPHSVLAALENRAGEVKQIVLPPHVRTREDDAWNKVVKLARSKGVPVVAGADGGGPPGTGGRGSTAEGFVQEKAGVSAEELFAGAKEFSSGGALWLALDCLKDPHNVGAVFRTAAFFGVRGILLTEERSAPLSETVYDVASGGMEHVPFTLQINLQRAFEAAQKAGLWILGTSEHAHDSLQSIQPDRPWLVVLGSEESGMRRLTEESCDLLCKIPAAAQSALASLNVSVAAGIVMARLSASR